MTPNAAAEQPSFTHSDDLAVRVEAVLVVPSDTSTDMGRVCAAVLDENQAPDASAQECLSVAFGYDVFRPAYDAATNNSWADWPFTVALQGPDGYQVQPFIWTGASGALATDGFGLHAPQTDGRQMFLFPGAGEGSVLSFSIEVGDVTVESVDWVVPNDLPALDDNDG